MPLITRAQLAAVAPKADAKIVSAIADRADDVLPRYGLATAARLPHFLAHVLVESAYLTTLEENLNYTAERAHAVWPSRFPTIASAQPYARNPQALANKVYGGRMGNVGPDDGWLNRGMGGLQTTGLTWRQKLSKKLGVPVEQVRHMLTSQQDMLECAAATYILTGAPAYADRGDIEGETIVINGGTNGLADRKAMLAKCQKIWGNLPATGIASAPGAPVLNGIIAAINSAAKPVSTPPQAPAIQPVSVGPHNLPPPQPEGFWARLVSAFNRKAF